MPEDNSTLATLFQLINRSPNVQTMGGISASPITPPFNPNGGQDIMALLNQILPQQAAPVASKEPLLKTILNSLAQAVSVGTSPNPSGALGQQLQQQQALQLQEQAYQRERVDKLNDLRTTFGLGMIKDQMNEQADIRKEGRQQGYRKEELRAIEEANVREFNRQYRLAEDQSNWNFKNQKAIMDIANRYKIEADDKIAAADLLDKQIALKVSMTKSGIEAGVAGRIVDKWYRKEALSKAEEHALTASARRALTLAARGSGGGAGGIGSLSARQVFTMMMEGMKSDYAELDNGSIVDIQSVPKDFMGRPIGMKRQLSHEEGMKLVSEKYAPIMMEAVKNLNKPTVKPQSGDRPDPGLQEKSDHYRNQFLQLSQQANPEAAAQALRKYAEKNPADKAVIEGVIIQELKPKKK